MGYAAQLQHSPLGTGIIRRDLLERRAQPRNIAKHHRCRGDQREAEHAPIRVRVAGKGQRRNRQVRRARWAAIRGVSGHGLRDLVRHADAAVAAHQASPQRAGHQRCSANVGHAPANRFEDQPVGVRRRRRSRLGEDDSAGQDDGSRRFQPIRPPQFGEPSRVDLARRGGGDVLRHRRARRQKPAPHQACRMADVANVARQRVQCRQHLRFRVHRPHHGHDRIIEMRYREPPRLARAPLWHDLEIDLLGVIRSLVVRRYEHVGGCPYRVISGMDRGRTLRFQPLQRQALDTLLAPRRPGGNQP